MTAALSPGVSWLIVGGWLLALVLVVLFFMGASRRGREWDEDEAWRRMVPTVPVIRILGGVYDHEVRGDFDR